MTFNRKEEGGVSSDMISTRAAAAVMGTNEAEPLGKKNERSTLDDLADE